MTAAKNEKMESQSKEFSVSESAVAIFIRAIFRRLRRLLPIAGDDFDFGLANLLAHFPEFGGIHDECPHVVAEAIRVQVSFEGELGADASRQRRIDGFVKLQ